ncbi:MAG: xylose isomerase, partial [Candidatus Latescibacteria bacterium]|nr:xylose isomerase [Candidatus Latescibacterota bacterium]
MAQQIAQKPQLRMVAAAWTLSNYPTPKRPWSVETKVKKAKEAGFVGISAGADPQLAEALHQHGMVLVGGVDVGSSEEAPRKLRAFHDLGTVHINVQLCDHDTPTDGAVEVARTVMEIGKSLQIKPAIEVHRDTCTETPEKAFALAGAYEQRYGEKLRMNFDHSHPAIIKQIRPAEYWDRLSERLDLLQMGELIHLRPFTGSHCQTPVTNGKGKLDRDFKVWLGFCEHLLTAWLEAAEPGKELFAVPELGPQGSGYA